MEGNPYLLRRYRKTEYPWYMNRLDLIESFKLEKSLKIFESNRKHNTAKSTKTSNGTTKHPSPGALYSAAGGDDSEDKGYEFLTRFPSSNTDVSLWTYPNS